MRSASIGLSGSAGVAAEQRRQQAFGALGGQRVEADPRVGALVAPAVLVLRPVGREEEMRAPGRLSTRPSRNASSRRRSMEVLDTTQERLPLALAQQQAPSASTVCPWRRGGWSRPTGGRHGKVEQGEERGRRRERRGRAPAPPITFSRTSRVVAVVDLEVRA